MDNNNDKTIKLTEDNIRKSLEFLGINSEMLVKGEDGKLDLKTPPDAGNIDKKTKEENSKELPKYNLSPEEHSEIKKEKDDKEKEDEAKKKKEQEEKEIKTEVEDKPEVKPEDEPKVEDNNETETKVEDKPKVEDTEKDKNKKDNADDDNDELFKKIEKSIQNSISQISNDFNSRLENLENLYKSEISNLHIKTDDLAPKLEKIERVINKGFGVIEDKFHSVGELNKAILEESSNIEKAISGDLFSSIDRRLKSIENQPLPRKSLLGQSDIIHKGFDTVGNPSNDMKQLSLTRDRGQILSILEDKSGINSDRQNNMYLDALSLYECSKTLEKAVIEDLYKSEKIIITN